MSLEIIIIIIIIIIILYLTTCHLGAKSLLNVNVKLLYSIRKTKLYIL